MNADEYKKELKRLYDKAKADRQFSLALEILDRLKGVEEVENV